MDAKTFPESLPAPETRIYWKPYEDSWLEVPLWGYFLIKLPSTKCCKHLPAKFYGLRWMLLSPFRPQVSLGSLGFWSIGEITMICIFTALAILAGVFCFDSPVLIGVAAEIPLVLVYSLGARNSIWTLLLGLPFERAILWHQFFAVTSIALGITHACSAWPLIDFRLQVSGLVCLASMGALMFMGFAPIRRKYWDLWLRFHWVLFLLVGVAGLLHGISGILVGGGAWLIDVLFRYGYMAHVKYPKKVGVAALPGNLVRIQFPKGNFDYKSGQYLILCAPQLSLLEWHPFSISSAPHQNFVTCHIRVLGDWTSRLHKFVLEKNMSEINVLLEGPFGCPAVDLDSDRYKCVLLISGGIGITPMHSICNDLIFQHKMKGRPLKKIWFVWSVREKQMIDHVLDHGSTGMVPTVGTEMVPNRSQQFDSLVLTQTGVSSKEVFKGGTFDKTVSDQEVLIADFYMSAAKTDEFFMTDDFNPKVRPLMKCGRPNFAQIIDQMSQIAKESGESEIAVCACGPMPLIKDCAKICFEKSTSSTRIHFHSEVFDL